MNFFVINAFKIVFKQIYFIFFLLQSIDKWIKVLFKEKKDRYVHLLCYVINVYSDYIVNSMGKYSLRRAIS